MEASALGPRGLALPEPTAIVLQGRQKPCQRLSRAHKLPRIDCYVTVFRGISGSTGVAWVLHERTRAPGLIPWTPTCGCQKWGLPPQVGEDVSQVLIPDHRGCPNS